MIVPTPTLLGRYARRLDRRNRGVTTVLAQMRGAGASLHKHFARGRPVWVLSTGGEVPPDIATLVIANGNVVDVGDTLFGGELSQTFRYATNPRR
jgi:hypothetical protein